MTNYRKALQQGVDASGFSGNLSGSDTDVQAALATMDALSLGILVKSSFSKLAADVVTTNLDNPPTVQLHTFEYVKLLAGSVLDISIDISGRSSIALSGMLYQIDVDGVKYAMTEGTSASTYRTESNALTDRVSGLSAGAHDVTVYFAAKISGEAAVQPVTVAWRYCNILVDEKIV